jgi:tetratricopeptide (TPR) repeat protein
MRGRLILTIAAVLFIAATACWALESDHYIQRGDISFERGEFMESLNAYEAGLLMDDDNYGLLWRIARCYGRLSVEVADKGKAAGYVLKQEEFARRAVSSDPEGFEGYLYLSEALAKLLAHAPFDKVYKFIYEIRETAMKAIEISPGEAKPYFIMGVWHRKITRAPWYQKVLARAFFGRLPETDMKSAVFFLEKAVELDPTRVKYHYELAMTYMMMGDRGSAASELRKAAACEPAHRWDEETIRSARELLDRAAYRRL